MLSSGVGGFKWCQLQKLVPFHMQCPGCVVCLHARRHTHHHSTVQAIRYKPLLWPCCGVPEGQVEASCRTPAALSSYRCARAVGAPSPQRVRRLRGRQGTMHLNMNSGLFYIKASAKTVAFMDRIAARLSREKAWDQARARPRPHGQA